MTTDDELPWSTIRHYGLSKDGKVDQREICKELPLTLYYQALVPIDEARQLWEDKKKLEMAREGITELLVYFDRYGNIQELDSPLAKLREVLK